MAILNSRNIFDYESGLSLDDKISIVEEKIEKEIRGLRDDVIESILLGSGVEAVSVYSLCYEEYQELPAEVRL